MPLEIEPDGTIISGIFEKILVITHQIHVRARGIWIYNVTDKVTQIHVNRTQTGIKILVCKKDIRDECR